MIVQVVGHRGAAGLVPENTLKGFNLAIELGVSYVECDVHLTRDGHLVVMHDATVDRTTNGSGAIASLDFAAIRELDAGDGERTPALDEVLQSVHGRVTLLCELKGEAVEDAAVDAVVARDMASEVVFTSFHMDRLAKVKQRGGHLQIGAIFKNPSDDDIAHALDLGVVSISIHYKYLNLHMIEQVHGAGVLLRAWNPDTLREQKAMIALGVTCISTNRPDILLDYLHSL